MEPFPITIEVASLTEDNFVAMEVMVAERVSHSGFPASFLTALGVTPTERRARFRSGDGEVRYFDMGPCRLKLDGHLTYHDVVFLDEGMTPQIGFVTLGEYGLEIDSSEPRLVEAVRYMPLRMRVV